MISFARSSGLPAATLMASFLVSGTAVAAEAQKLWEVTGLAGPESALLDAKSNTIYVSNVNGDAVGKDGNGFIAKISLDGKNVDKNFSTGLNAPMGLAKVGDKLYTADIDELVEINLADGKVLAKYKVEGAGRLNDVAADAKGNVYTTDTIKNGIFVLKGGKMEKWIDAPELAGPNGITIDGDNMISASWGILIGKGFETSTPGRMISISLADKKLTALDGGKPVANLDGIEPLGDGNYIVSDWMAGKVMKFTKDGKLEPIIDLGQGTADMAYDKATKIMYVPQMMKGTLTAVTLP